MSNTASLLCTNPCIPALLVLQLIVAAMLIACAGHSGGGEQPTYLLDPSSEPTSPHLLEFQCIPTRAIHVDPECPSPEHDQPEKLGALRTGLEVLWDYTKELRSSWVSLRNHIYLLTRMLAHARIL